MPKPLKHTLPDGLPAEVLYAALKRTFESPKSTKQPLPGKLIRAIRGGPDALRSFLSVDATLASVSDFVCNSLFSWVRQCHPQVVSTWIEPAIDNRETKWRRGVPSAHQQFEKAYLSPQRLAQQLARVPQPAPGPEIEALMVAVFAFTLLQPSNRTELISALDSAGIPASQWFAAKYQAPSTTRSDIDTRTQSPPKSSREPVDSDGTLESTHLEHPRRVSNLPCEPKHLDALRNLLGSLTEQQTMLEASIRELGYSDGYQRRVTDLLRSTTGHRRTLIDSIDIYQSCPRACPHYQSTCAPFRKHLDSANAVTSLHDAVESLVSEHRRVYADVTGILGDISMLRLLSPDSQLISAETDGLGADHLQRNIYELTLASAELKARRSAIVEETRSTTKHIIDSLLSRPVREQHLAAELQMLASRCDAADDPATLAIVTQELESLTQALSSAPLSLLDTCGLALAEAEISPVQLVTIASHPESPIELSTVLLSLLPHRAHEDHESTRDLYWSTYIALLARSAPSTDRRGAASFLLPVTEYCWPPPVLFEPQAAAHVALTAPYAPCNSNVLSHAATLLRNADATSLGALAEAFSRGECPILAEETSIEIAEREAARLRKQLTTSFNSVLSKSNRLPEVVYCVDALKSLLLDATHLEKQPRPKDAELRDEVIAISTRVKHSHFLKELRRISEKWISEYRKHVFEPLAASTPLQLSTLALARECRTLRVDSIQDLLVQSNPTELTANILTFRAQIASVVPRWYVNWVLGDTVPIQRSARLAIEDFVASSDRPPESAFNRMFESKLLDVAASLPGVSVSLRDRALAEIQCLRNDIISIETEALKFPEIDASALVESIKQHAQMGDWHLAHPAMAELLQRLDAHRATQNESDLKKLRVRRDAIRELTDNLAESGHDKSWKEEFLGLLRTFEAQVTSALDGSSSPFVRRDVLLRTERAVYVATAALAESGSDLAGLAFLAAGSSEFTQEAGISSNDEDVEHFPDSQRDLRRDVWSYYLKAMKDGNESSSAVANFYPHLFRLLVMHYSRSSGARVVPVAPIAFGAGSRGVATPSDRLVGISRFLRPGSEHFDREVRVHLVPSLEALDRVLDELQEEPPPRKSFELIIAPSSTSRLERLALQDPDVVDISPEEMRRIVGAPHPGAALRQRLRRSIGVSLTHPFKSEGYIPSHSTTYIKRRTFKQLVSGRSYALAGGRRSGKTSILHHATEHRRNDGVLARYVSMEHLAAVTSVEEVERGAVLALSRALEFGAETVERFHAEVEGWLRSKGPVALFIDEIDPYIRCHRSNRSQQFGLMRCLRSLSNTFSSKFSCVVAGFKDLFTVLREKAAPDDSSYPWQNWLESATPLLALDVSDVQKMLHSGYTEVLGLEMTPDVPNLMYLYSGGSPAAVQKLASMVMEDIDSAVKRDPKRMVTADDVDRVFERNRGITFVRFVGDTLDMNFGPLERIIMYVIAAAMIGPTRPGNTWFEIADVRQHVGDWFEYLDLRLPERVAFDQAFEFLNMTGMLELEPRRTRMRYAKYAEVLSRLEETEKDKIDELIGEYNEGRT